MFGSSANSEVSIGETGTELSVASGSDAEAAGSVCAAVRVESEIACKSWPDGLGKTA
jgi:hypothetical protein